jgi:decaprenylphospho-beta-D-erythro-pentofuranosid-2-ulose 2-reductase
VHLRPNLAMARNVLVFGATSAIAHAIDRRFAGEGASLVLVGRDRPKLEANAADLSVRGATKILTLAADLNDFAGHRELIDRAVGELGRLDIVLIAHGTLPDQEGCENNVAELRRAIDTNLASVMSLSMAAASRLVEQRQGSLVVIGSVAGDRGRRRNYVYGAAKAGVAVFCDGLRARLRPSGVHVLTVKPGFVDTPMTAGFAKGMLWVAPERIATAVCRAIEQRKSVIYAPWFWRPIMFAIRALPSAILSRLNI